MFQNFSKGAQKSRKITIYFEVKNATAPWTHSQLIQSNVYGKKSETISHISPLKKKIIAFVK